MVEREEEAGQLSHNTQSADAFFGHVTITCLATSADSVAVVAAKVAAVSLDSVLPAVILDTLASSCLLWLVDPLPDSKASSGNSRRFSRDKKLAT